LEGIPQKVWVRVMPWIRFDCSTLDDEFCIELAGEEFKAWALFLLRVKAMGARGRVKVAALSSLSRNWGVPEKSIRSMLHKAATAKNRDGEPSPKIKEANGTWYVVNWSRYQDDYRGKKGEESTSTEVSVDDKKARNGATLPHTTPQDTTEDISHNAPRREETHSTAELREQEYVLRLRDEEFTKWVRSIQQRIVQTNQARPHNPFVWVSTTGSPEKDLRWLIYQFPDDDKCKILREASNALDGHLNWPLYVERWIGHMVNASEKNPIKKPFLWMKTMLSKPHDLVSSVADGLLADYPGLKESMRAK
jgi:hypothetical protein